MDKYLEFQAVVLAAGRGSRFPDVGGNVSKFLLPIGPYPILWYSLKMLEKWGFNETIIVILKEDESNIKNALEKCPLSIKCVFITIETEGDCGTVDALKKLHKSDKISTDLVVVSGDLITNVNLSLLLNIYRKHDAALTALYFNNGPEEWIELPGPKSKVKAERDLIGIDKETQRLVFVKSASDFTDNVSLPRILIQKFDSVSLHSRLLDAHLYIMKKWIIDFIVDSKDRFISVKGDLLPYIVKKQLSRSKSPPDNKNIDIFNYALNTGYEQKIRQMSAYNDHLYGNRGVYNGDFLRCYAHIPDKNTFGIRVNTLSSFYLANDKILDKWTELYGTPMTNRIHSENVKTKQMDERSTVGHESEISERTSIRESFIGNNCVVENKVTLSKCILMNNVTVRERCILDHCILYNGVTIESGCKLSYCIVGPHHVTAQDTAVKYQLLAETNEDVIVLGIDSD